MVTVISRFRVRNGLEQEVRRAFLNRPRLVEKAPGFRGIQVLTDAADPSQFLLVTHWTDEEAFRAWHRSEAHHESHVLIPKGLKLDASFTSLTIGNALKDDSAMEKLSDAIESEPGKFSQWLMDSDTVFALILTRDGTIRARNRVAERIFPFDPAKKHGSWVWDYLVDSDVEHLRNLIFQPDIQQDGSFLLNLTDGLRSPITWQANLLPCGESILLLGALEHQHDSHFQTEILSLTNELTVAMRETSRKNRELKEANELIEKLVRTDSLTGMANRRALDESIPREIARAERLRERLSAIFIDMDDFKQVNDSYGHLAGNHVLARSSEVFKRLLRPYDLAARYGGDEFVLLLPGSSLTDSLAVAERIRQDVATLKTPECPRPITVSLGVAGWMAGETPQRLLARADTALLRAKEKGGNCVEVASESQIGNQDGEASP